MLALSSPAWKDGGTIPVKYAQPGSELSPPLVWTPSQDSTIRSYVLMVRDLNAFSGGAERLHWLVWNIPATATSLPEGVPHGPELPGGARQISTSGPYYRGPAAAPADPVHHYMFELFALDSIIDVPSVNAQPGPTRTAVLQAMEGRIRGKAVLFGLYRHPR
jgi:Raf kinase inhibitor-like YbhB/YbcL family protein